VTTAGCARSGLGGWQTRALSAQTIEWKQVSGQHLPDVLATPSIEARRVDLVLCRWQTGVPIRVAWPAAATDRELAAFEQARAAWSSVVDGLELVTTTDADADVHVTIVEPGDPAAPTGTADTVVDCTVSAGARALARRDERGRIVSSSIVLRRENIDWAGRASPMSDEEFLGMVLHELGHALGISGHVGSRGSVMSIELSSVRRAARRLEKGEGFRAPTLVALYSVPVGAVVGAVGFDSELRPSLDALAALAEESGWRGPFGRAGGDSAHVFWQTPDGAHPGVLTYEWTDGIRGKRSLDWRLNLSARSALDAVTPREPVPGARTDRTLGARASSRD
jgi:hypothetical protein